MNAGEGDRRDVVGVLLCGGASRRMGRDKALLTIEGTSFLERALRVLDAVSAPVLLATGGTPRYASFGREQVLDAVGFDGPLAGLLAGLERAAELGAAWVAALACDLVVAGPEHLRALLDRAGEHEADFCLWETERGPEPLLAVYCTSCRTAVRRALEAGERRMVSFHRGFGKLRGVTVHETELPAGPQGSPAWNVNTPADLSRVEGGSS